MPLFLVALNSFLILSTNINLYPEFYFYPFLISKGLLIYRDFFINHGYLLYYLLVPISFDKSLLILKTFYFLIQTLNLVLFLIIARKTNNWLGSWLGGLLFVLLNFYLSDNNLWDEIIISSIYLAFYYFFAISKHRCRLPVMGIIVAAASLIKPTAGLVIILPLLFEKTLIPFIFFAIPWFFTVIYFALNWALPNLIDNLFLFNRYYAGYFWPPQYFWLERSIAYGSLLVLGLTTVLNIITKKINPRLITMFLVSFVFIVPMFTKVSFTVALPFFLLVLISPLSLANKHLRLITIVVLLFFLLIVVRKTKHQYASLQSRIPYAQNQQEQLIISKLKERLKPHDTIFVYGNQVNLYYFLDRVTPTHFPIIFSWVAAYYPDFENRLVADLKQNKVNIIIQPQSPDENYLNFARLNNYVENNYHLETKSKNFWLYRKRIR